MVLDWDSWFFTRRIPGLGITICNKITAVIIIYYCQDNMLLIHCTTSCTRAVWLTQLDKLINVSIGLYLLCFPPPIFAYFVLNACSHKKLFFLFKWIFRLWMEKRTVSTSVVIPLDFNLKKLRHWSCRKWKSGNKCMSVDWNYMTFNYLISEILFINLHLVFWQFSSVSQK